MFWHILIRYGLLVSLIYVMIDFFILRILLGLLVISNNPKHKHLFKKDNRLYKNRWFVLTVILLIKMIVILYVGSNTSLAEFLFYTGLYLIFILFFYIKKIYKFKS